MNAEKGSSTEAAMSDATSATKKRRRARGSGSIYLKGHIYWIAYRGPDGRRIKESSGSKVMGVARRLMERRVGARELGLPVIPKIETTTFDDAAKAVIDDFKNADKKSLADVERRLRLHLTPVFGGKRLVNITAADIRAFVSKRREAERVIHKARVVKRADGTEEHVPAERRPVSIGEVNRELQLLKRLLNLAVKDGRLARRPHIQMLEENNIRQGFFEPAQLTAVLDRLPEPIRSVIAFAAATGWRINEVLTLEWRHVDFDRGSVHLDPAKSKNKEARTFPMTAELRALLKAQDEERERLKREGHIVPTVFFKMVAKGRGGEKTPKAVGEFRKTWHNACRAAGCPGKIPHDLRRTAVRNFVRAGIPERVAMQLTGHKTRSVFERYNIVSGGDLEDAAARLDMIASGVSMTSRASG